MALIYREIQILSESNPKEHTSRPTNTENILNFINE